MTFIVARWTSILGLTIATVGVQSNRLIDDSFSTIGNTGLLQLSYQTWYPDYPDLQDWPSKFFAKGGQGNFINYGQNRSSVVTQQQAVQVELARADGDQNQAERLKLYQDAEQKMVNDVGWIPITQTVFAEVVNPKLQGWKVYPLGNIETDDWASIYFVQ